jgi:preprotein translocase subunit SecG
MKYAFEMDSGAMVYIPSFTEIVSGVQKLMGGYSDTQTAWRLHKLSFILFHLFLLFIFFIYLFIFLNQEDRLENERTSNHNLV